MQTHEKWVWSLDQEDLLEEEMTTHSSILAWRNPWTVDPSELVYIIAKNRTWLKWLGMHTCITICVYKYINSVQFNSVSQSCLTFLQPHGLQHARLCCPSPTPGACSNSCPLSQWCHSTISSSVIPFSSCLWSFPASGSFPVARLSSHQVAKVLELQLQHQSFQ